MGASKGLVRVAHLENIELVVACRGANRYEVALMGLEQSPGDWRNPANPPLQRGSLINAYNCDCLLLALPVGVGHSCTEKYLIPVGLLCRLHHLGDFQTLGQKTQPAINFPQTALTIYIVPILGTIPIRGRPADGINHLGTLDIH